MRRLWRKECFALHLSQVNADAQTASLKCFDGCEVRLKDVEKDQMAGRLYALHDFNSGIDLRKKRCQLALCAVALTQTRRGSSFATSMLKTDFRKAERGLFSSSLLCRELMSAMEL